VHMDTMMNLALYKEVFGWMGTPYRYSGESKTGTDCSGLVSNIVRNVYHCSLSASSRDIFRQDVTPLSKDDLCEGDLVFFRIRKKSISHVGIYLGGDLFVHASSRQGVVISNLQEPYYRKSFYKGGRIKN